MSHKAKLFFVSSCFVSGLIIYKVHDFQKSERDRMRLGVIKDIERRSLNKVEKDQQRHNNLQMIEQQLELEKSLKK